MWKHATKVLVCPACARDLSLSVLQARSASQQAGDESSGTWVDSGWLACRACGTIYVIHQGVPILLPYATAAAQAEHASWPSKVHAALTQQGLSLPTAAPPPGERCVAASFSTEWRDYDYGPTLWTASTADRKRAFHGECGLGAGELRGERFCEIGCGLGILTHEAVTQFGAEAWGIDISTSVFRAARQFADNPRLHFLQASVLSAPLATQQFAFVYSHGVLHHTWNTKEALRRAKMLVSPGGTLYVWLYGYDDVRISVSRRVAFRLESATRPVLARLPQQVVSLVLAPLVPLYQAASYFGQHSGTHGSTYTARQALHAARDRFTPLYAHRQEFDDVAEWFAEIGLGDVHRVQGGEVPASWALAMERNVAIRGRRCDA